MAKRNSGRRGTPAQAPRPASRGRRSRRAQPRRRAGRRSGSGEPPRAADAPRARRAAQPARRQRAASPSSSAALGERPQAPWHPLPLSELLDLRRHRSRWWSASRARSGPCRRCSRASARSLIGTLEFTLREHLSGYRSHTSLLASCRPRCFHAAVAVLLVALGRPRRLGVVPLALDVPVFVVAVQTAARALPRRAPRAQFGSGAAEPQPSSPAVAAAD